jgi:exodeoxyribonuclease VII large subunit
VARAIAASPIPVVSAVGHEIDFTIADFAADFRAPTPSAAAEILAADSTAIIAKLNQDLGRMIRAAVGRIEFATARLDGLKRSGVFREPVRLLEESRQTLDRRFDDMQHAAVLALERARGMVRQFFSSLESQSPLAAIRQSRVHIGHLFQHIGQLSEIGAEKTRARLDKAASVLAALNPEAELARGYTMTLDKDGRFLSSAKKVKKGAVLLTRFKDGEVQSVVSDR